MFGSGSLNVKSKSILNYSYTVPVKKFQNGPFRLRCVVLVSVFRKWCKTVVPFRSAVHFVLKSRYTA